MVAVRNVNYDVLNSAFNVSDVTGTKKVQIKVQVS